MRTSLIIIALAVVACIACVVWLGSRPDETVAESVSSTSPGPSFEVRVVVPRMARPLAGILPDWVVGKLDGTPSEVRFDHASRGAEIVKVGQDHLELRADGWHFLIETDGERGVAPGTRLVFPLALGGRHVTLRCRPADLPRGFLQTSTRSGSGELDGDFVVEFATCENAASGKAVNWPPAPLTVRGRFNGLSGKN